LNSSDSNLPTVLLVRGAPRSGTSIVTELLNESPHVAIISEYPLAALAGDLDPIFAYEHAQRAELLELGFAHVDPDGTLRLGATLPNGQDYYWRGTARLPPASYPTHARRAQILTSVAAASLDKSQVRIIGSKTPGVATEGDRDALAGLFPAVRYLFVVRNPLDVINSSINRRNRARKNLDRWHAGDIAAVIDEYRHNMRYLRAHVARYGDDCFVLKYEDLTERYGDVRDALSDFLGVPLRPESSVIWHEQPPPIVLTRQERSRVAAAFGSLIDGWNDAVRSGSGPAAIAGLPSFDDAVVAAVPYRYGGPSGTRSFLGLGWHEPDGAGVWSRGPEADLLFTVPAAGEYTVQAELSTFARMMGRAATLSIRLDDVELFRAAAIQDGTAVATAPAAMVPGGTYRLTLGVDVTGSPARGGISDDPRTLGVCLHAVTFARKSPEEQGSGLPSVTRRPEPLGRSLTS
jgi:Sulfotransferase family